MRRSQRDIWGDRAPAAERCSACDRTGTKRATFSGTPIGRHGPTPCQSPGNGGGEPAQTRCAHQRRALRSSPEIFGDFWRIRRRSPNTICSTITALNVMFPKSPCSGKPSHRCRSACLLGGPTAQAAFRRHDISHDKASLDHQARDDTVCCNLVFVELTSTMSLKALVANRAPQRNPRMSRPV